MRPGDHVELTTNTIGHIAGTVNGWDVNGLKISVYDSYVTRIKWLHITTMRIT